MPEVRVADFSFAYPGSRGPALKNINLNIPGGEFVLVAGPSGCGKSTLALAIAGLIPSRISGPSCGQVFLDGKSLDAMDIHECAQHVGMVFQNPDDQLIHLDVTSEVAFGPENLGLARPEIWRRVRQALSATQTQGLAESPIYALSGGQKQRIAIAATLAMNPEVLVLDEPTSDLDPTGTQEVLGVIRRLCKARGMTVVLIEHKIDEVIAFADRVLLMDRGKIVLDAPPRRAFRSANAFESLGVSVPEVVRLSSRLPEVFGGEVALSVEEAAAALEGSPFHRRLISDAGGRPPQPPVPAKEPVIEWRDVGLAFGEHEVLKGLNLALRPGEWTALAGPNGSGKTSLASLAMGFSAPTRGQVLLRGHPVAAEQISRQAARVGYLFQSADTMLFAPSVRGELSFGKRYGRKKGGEALRDMSVEDLARLVDLSLHLETNPFHLSFGQRKRLALAALLSARPDTLILDEPTTGQDEGHSRAFLDFLEVLRQKWHMTFLMITHDMRAATRSAGRLVVLSEGRILLDGPPAEVFAAEGPLAEAHIVPPPMARLHSTLAGGRAGHVATDLEGFLSRIMPRRGIV